MRTTVKNVSQIEDQNILWIINLMREQSNTGIKLIVTEIDELKRRSLYQQWNQLLLLNNTLFREYVNSSDTIVYQPIE